MDLIAVGLGVAFGFCLERGGMAYAPKLAGQFTGADFTVLRVMFTAIVTAMLGIFCLVSLGWMDLANVYVPVTNVPAQALGGALFGVGFATAGLCPGTSCVAAATGRLDGLAVMAGLIVGVAPPLYDAAPVGPQTLPSALGLPYGVVVLLVVLLALVVFGVARTIDRRP
jgi:uncharacterized membrane protein YedE/YeeE